MSMTITITDHTANLIQAHLKSWGSAEALIESAVSMLIGQEEDVEWMRQEVEKGLQSGIRKWDPDQFEKEAHAILAARRTESCKTV